VKPWHVVAREGFGRRLKHQDVLASRGDGQEPHKSAEQTSGEGGIRNRAGEGWDVPAGDGSTENPVDPSAAGVSSSQGLPGDRSNVVNDQKAGQDPMATRVQVALDDARRGWRDRADREALRSALFRMLELLEP
jgi:hypothetical protein